MEKKFKADLVRLSLKAFVFVAVLPLAGVGVAQWGIHDVDETFRNEIAKDTSLTEEQREAFEQLPPSTWCASADPEIQQWSSEACSVSSDLGQFHMAHLVSLVSLALGALILVLIGALGAWAYARPNSQYAVLQFGRYVLTATSAVQIVIQGVLGVWLSYWVTALAFTMYVPKLIFLVALLALGAVWASLKGIFTRIPSRHEVTGYLIGKDSSPALWRRLESISQKIGTQPPSAVVAGIDENFFVTESPMQVRETLVHDRALFVSLPLLRVLSSKEADAVMAHELAHFRHGDTQVGARLGPALVRYQTYLLALSKDVFTWPAFWLMALFQTVFDVARMKESRRREFMADATAASVTSADDIGAALLKIAAYSSHRTSKEQELFAMQQQQTASTLTLRSRFMLELWAHA